MTLFISDQADEFRIDISGRLADSLVSDVATAWHAALSVNTPRRICVDITRMTGYDRSGYMLLREIASHGTHIAAGTPRSLIFLSQISTAKPHLVEDDASRHRRTASKQVVSLHARAVASGE